MAYLEAWYGAAGYRCGAYTSPHLLRYNERVRLAGAEASDAALCAAFARVERARADVPLTYFEFGTLVALDLFLRAALDVVVLEVGLGGRLDAVNLIDADVALVTMVGRDHLDFLGSDLDEIAAEKAGIFRAGRPAVIGSRTPPPRLRAVAEALGARPLQLGREFEWAAVHEAWHWQGPEGAVYADLPPPALPGRFQFDNAAAALCAVACLGDCLPVPVAAVRQGLRTVRHPGRFQILPGAPTWILDVAHNPDAARVLAATLAEHAPPGTRHAVCALLADKEYDAIVAVLAPSIDHWHLAAAATPRALSIARLTAAVAATGARPRVYSNLEAALAGAAAAARATDTVLVCGCFAAVAAALRQQTAGT